MNRVEPYARITYPGNAGYYQDITKQGPISGPLSSSRTASVVLMWLKMCRPGEKVFVQFGPNTYFTPPGTLPMQTQKK